MPRVRLSSFVPRQQLSSFEVMPARGKEMRSTLKVLGAGGNRVKLMCQVPRKERDREKIILLEESIRKEPILSHFQLSEPPEGQLLKHAGHCFQIT